MTTSRLRAAWAKAAYPGIIFILLCAIAYQLATRYIPAPVPPNNVSVPARIAPEIKRETTVATPIKAGTVQTYKPAMKAKLKLPDSVIRNDAQAVIAASQVKPNDHPQTVTTVIDAETGETETYVKEDPLPWLDWDTRGEAGLYLGLKNGETAARLEVRQGVLAIKSAHLGVIASADQPLTGPLRADYFVGAGVWMRW